MILNESKHVDLEKYKPEWIMGLSARKSICMVIIIVIIAVCVFCFNFYGGISVELGSWLAFIVATPAALIGFVEPKGYKFEKYILIKFKGLFMTNNKRKNQIRNRYYDMLVKDPVKQSFDKNKIKKDKTIIVRKDV